MKYRSIPSPLRHSHLFKVISRKLVLVILEFRVAFIKELPQCSRGHGDIDGVSGFILEFFKWLTHGGSFSRGNAT